MDCISLLLGKMYWVLYYSYCGELQYSASCSPSLKREDSSESRTTESQVVKILLLVAWNIDGAFCIRCVSSVQRSKSHSFKSRRAGNSTFGPGSKK